MHDKTRSFMNRLRQRAQRDEVARRRRLESIVARDETATDDTASRSPVWIDPSRADSHIGQRKSSILGLLRGDVKTESTANRNLKS